MYSIRPALYKYVYRLTPTTWPLQLKQAQYSIRCCYIYSIGAYVNNFTWLNVSASISIVGQRFSLPNFNWRTLYSLKLYCGTREWIKCTYLTFKINGT